ncbi:alpha/beta fold hydrolase [Candidatus Aalborgicola defluviihabitans]|uniref:alpha/beta fold hydrolase n=1 Tax=Candidatus Aalborgicola defluviihabitans TaxID=3386187 RepID=UPI001EBA1699|nr:alpha/beta hydrolase [Burkholderiales bacterium]
MRGSGPSPCGRNWPHQVCKATGREGWVYSRRGYGDSDPVPDVRGESRLVDGQRQGRLLPDYMHHEAWSVLPELLDHLGVVAPVLLGHSDGASIALLHASRHPVAACIVISAACEGGRHLGAINRTGARTAYESGDLRELRRYHADVDGAFWQWNDVWLSAAFRAFDIRQDCQRIGAPVLAIQGEDDPYGTMAQIDEIALPPSQIERHAGKLRPLTASRPDTGGKPNELSTFAQAS